MGETLQSVIESSYSGPHLLLVLYIQQPDIAARPRRYEQLHSSSIDVSKDIYTTGSTVLRCRIHTHTSYRHAGLANSAAGNSMHLKVGEPPALRAYVFMSQGLASFNALSALSISINIEQGGNK